MSSRLICILVAVLGGAILITYSVNSASSQTTRERGDFDLESIIAKLHDQELRKLSPKEFAEVIKKAGMLASANTFAKDDNTSPPNIYSVDLLSALIDSLDFEQPKRSPEFDASSGQPFYPAVRAIASMRKPVLPWLVEVLENENPDSLKYKNALSTVRLILHGDDMAAFNYLQAQAVAASTDNGKKRLLSAADLVQMEFEKHQKYVNQ